MICAGYAPVGQNTAMSTEYPCSAAGAGMVMRADVCWPAIENAMTGAIGAFADPLYVPTRTELDQAMAPDLATCSGVTSGVAGSKASD